MSVAAYIGCGSNLSDKQTLIESAHAAIAELPQSQWLACSSFYHSHPQGDCALHDFINTVVAIETDLAPLDLLSALQSIENQLGRVRETHWGPRTIDLDLLLYGDLVMQTDLLTIPHPQLIYRDFVLTPLAEIAPSLILPTGQSLKNALQQCAVFIFNDKK